MIALRPTVSSVLIFNIQLLETVRRVALSKKEVKELAAALGKVGDILREAELVEVVELEGGRVLYIVDSEPALIKAQVQHFGEVVLPTIYLLNKSKHAQRASAIYPMAIVDTGAVKHILNGADVMRPGIKQILGDFNKGDVAQVADEKRRIIAVGLWLYSRSEVEAMEKGKVIYNVHYLGDRLWKLFQELSKK